MIESSPMKFKREAGTTFETRKRVFLDVPASTATVQSVLQSASCPPVIATTPGLEVSPNIAFHPYLSEEGSTFELTQRKKSKVQEMLLYSTSHHSLDYTARQECQRQSTPLVNHFVGIYDAKTGRVEMIEAKKMVVRGVVRSKRLPTSTADGEDETKMSILDRRTDLGQAFGTKKAKKALLDNALNSIISPIKAGESPIKAEDAGNALLESVNHTTAQMATKEMLQTAINEAKPIPKPNLDAEHIRDVYDPQTVIGADILDDVPIREWQEKARRGEGIQTASRFVAVRVNALATNEDAVTRLQVLRYFNLVLMFYLGSKPAKQRGTRLVPSRDKLRELLAPASEVVMESIRRKFSDAGVMRKFHIDLLMTSCCVFACIVDNFEVDTQNLRDDLRTDQRRINSYFREIGGQVRQVSIRAEGEEERTHVMHVAKLTLPLILPKQRQMAPRSQRK